MNNLRTPGQAFHLPGEALEEDSFDAVNLTLSDALHVRAAQESFFADKHVVLEKSMTPDLESCNRILDAAKLDGRCS